MLLKVLSLIIASLISFHGEAVGDVFSPGDRISIVGNTFAERMQLNGHFEAAMQAALPDHDLSIRNYGWSGDEVALQPRPYKFMGMDEWLRRHQTDVLIACFGMNESYAGYEGLSDFKRDLEAWMDDHLSTSYNDEGPPRIILVSPIAHEDLGPPLPDGEDHNFILDRYVRVMRQVALRKGALFIDLFDPTRDAMRISDEPLTINGIHPNQAGYRLVACEMLAAMGIDVSPESDVTADERQLHEVLRESVLEKNRLFFQRWRPVNTEYVYGRRHEPYGTENFPDEMVELDRLIGVAETRLWTVPTGKAGCLCIEVPYR
tara:strand:+ start:11521 stop:12474 length:954 start_codon:yes stop_codon:yes gene_type:complete